MDGWQKYAAELLGTFVLVFGGTTAIVATSLMGVPRPVCGARSPSASRSSPASTPSARSPAVTTTPPSRWRCSSTAASRAADLVRYWAAQFAGGDPGVARPAPRDEPGRRRVDRDRTGRARRRHRVPDRARLHGDLRPRHPPGERQRPLRRRARSLAIPLALVAVHLAAIPFSGSSVNPARTFGPALVGNEWSGIWIYFIAPPLGAALAVAIHRGVMGAGMGRPEAAVAEVLEEGDAPDAGRRR